jgi:galactonate dehydratase
LKITNIETFVVDAGWRPWLFVKVETDEGITGWGECSDGANPMGIKGTIEDLKQILVGKDPREFEKRFGEMYRMTRQSPGGIASKAIAGLDCAFIDIKARALGISVAELFGGPTRDNVRVYWSHCGGSRVRNHELIGVPPLQTWNDITALGKEVVDRGFTALKTNVIGPGDPAFWVRTGNDQVASRGVINHIEKLIGTFREAVGSEVDINLDLNFHFKPESCLRIAKVLEQFDMLWLEIDMYQPESLRQIKDSTTTRICTGENLFYMRDYLPYFQNHAADMFMIDVPWNGFSQSKKVGDLAEVFQHNVAPHNYYSHLSTFISATLCAVLPNVRIMEIDIDDVPWKDDLTTDTPEIINGYMTVPTKPGWGVEIDEDVARAHPWQGHRSRDGSAQIPSELLTGLPSY